MPGSRILIIGGTGEARAAAAALIDAGFAPITSLAGVTHAPLLPEGTIRNGGFGGIEGLRNFLASERIAAIVDASHPFAAQISRHAHGAAQQAGLAYFRLERPAWTPQPGDRWMEAGSIAEAAAALPAHARALVTIGRKDVGVFFARRDVSGVARMIEPPACDVPDGWTVILERPPFTIEAEAALMAAHGITHLVSKNAGGIETAAKLVAAREKNIPVIMVRRPAKPDAPSYSRIEVLIPALRRSLSP